MMRTLRRRALLSGRYGIAAISDPKFFTENATYILSGLNTWGWVTLIYGRWCARHHRDPATRHLGIREDGIGA
jgi:hypothetical protein